METTSGTQRAAIRMMRERNLGAVYTVKGWIFPEDVRQSVEVADVVLRSLRAPGACDQMR
jgi:hypothetical protein